MHVYIYLCVCVRVCVSMYRRIDVYMYIYIHVWSTCLFGWRHCYTVLRTHRLLYTFTSAMNILHVRIYIHRHTYRHVYIYYTFTLAMNILHVYICIYRHTYRQYIYLSLLCRLCLCTCVCASQETIA